MTWSGSSSTPWCCAPTCRATRRSPSCWAGCGRPALGALEHQDVPFERLVEVLAPAPVAGPPPAVPGHAHRAEQRPAGRLDLPGLPAPGCRPAPAQRQVRPGCHPGRGARSTGGARPGCAGRSTAAADLFDQATAEAIAARLARVLAAVAADPAGPAAPGRGARRRPSGAQILAGWNDTAAPVPAATLPELFAAQAAADPGCGRGGVRGRGAELRGAERGGRAGWRGIWRRVGAGPESVVAVVLERSAGAGRRRSWACSRPGRRTCRSTRATRRSGSAFMLADAGPALVVTARGHRGGRCPAGGAVPVLVLDDPAVAAAGGSARLPARRGRPGRLRAGHPAYVIYTRGPPGSPRAWWCTHGGVVNLAVCAGGRFGLGWADRVLAVRRRSVSMRRCGSCWWPLAGGAALVVARRGSLAVAELAGCLARQRVTHVRCRRRCWPAGGGRRRWRCWRGWWCWRGRRCRGELAEPVRPVPGAAGQRVRADRDDGDATAVSGPLADGGRRRCRSAGRWRIPGCLCWMGGWGRCRRGWRGSCMWRGRGWRGGIWAGRG